VNSPMRRTIFLALLATLLLPCAARASDTDAIIRDCAQDSTLEGHYTVAELRKALDHLPKDVDEYSDCSDVLSTAIANQTTRKDDSSGSGTGSGGSSGGSSGGGGSNGSQPSSPTRHRPSATDQDFVVGASTPQDHKAVSEAAIKGGGPLQVDGHAVVPNARLASDIGRNGLPAALIAVLALLCALALAATAPLVRRRVVAHRQP
jgi:hypothetical protein